MAIRPPLPRLSLVLGMGTLLACMPDLAIGASFRVEGMHIHRSGTSPHFLKAAQVTLKAYEDQCRLMKSVCATMPAGARARDKAACAQITGAFSVKGNPADIGKQETDEYFATGLNMAARQTTKTLLQVKSVCEVEVVDHKDADLWHYTPSGHTHYVLKNDPRKGRFWMRTEHKQRASVSGGLLAGVFPLTDASKVSAVLKQKTIAGHRCEVRDVVGPWSGTFCLKATPSTFPGQVALEGTVMAGNEIMFEDQATEVAEKVMLPRAVFFPPQGDTVESQRTVAQSRNNATQQWCAKQKMETGVNPCENRDER